MRTAAVFCLLVASSLQWAFNPADFAPNSNYIPERRPTRMVVEEPRINYLANPFVSPLAIKWRKMRSRRDFIYE